MISGFRREVGEICAYLEYYVPHGGKSLPTFRDNLTVPSSRVKQLRKTHRGVLCVISCFRCEIDEICPLLGYYAAYSGKSLPTFRYNI